MVNIFLHREPKSTENHKAQCIHLNLEYIFKKKEKTFKLTV